MTDTEQTWVSVKCPECGWESHKVVNGDVDPEVGDVGEGECGHCTHIGNLEVIGI